MLSVDGDDQGERRIEVVEEAGINADPAGASSADAMFVSCWEVERIRCPKQ